MEGGQPSSFGGLQSMEPSAPVGWGEEGAPASPSQPQQHTGAAAQPSDGWGPGLQSVEPSAPVGWGEEGAPASPSQPQQHTGAAVQASDSWGAGLQSVEPSAPLGWGSDGGQAAPQLRQAASAASHPPGGSWGDLQSMEPTASVGWMDGPPEVVEVPRLQPPGGDWDLQPIHKLPAYEAKLATEKPLDRQRLIEFVSHLKWSRDTLVASPLGVCLLLALLAVVSVRSNTEDSFAIQSSVQAEIKNVVAWPYTGTAPVMDVASSAGTSTMCYCACAYTREELCYPDSKLVYSVNTSVPLTVLPELRSRSAYVNKQIPPHAVLGWKNLSSAADVLFWLQHGLIPKIWHEDSPENPISIPKLMGNTTEAALSYHALPGPGDKPGTIRLWSSIVGGIRLRQIRMKKGKCRIPPTLVSRYKQLCYSTDPEDMPYGPGASSFADGFMPQGVVPGAFDYLLPIDVSLGKTLQNVQYMLTAYDWLDTQTSALEIKAVIFNAEENPPLLGLLTLQMNFLASGAIVKNIYLPTVLADQYSGLSYYAADFVWAFFVFLFAVKQVVLIVKQMQMGTLRHHFDFWNTLDLVTILLSGAILIVFAVYVTSIRAVTVMIGQMPPPISSTSTTVEITTFNNAWTNIITAMDSVVAFNDNFRVALFCLSFLNCFQIFQVMRGQLKLAQLSFTVAAAVEDLLHFLFIFVVMFITFAFGGYLVWGLYLDQWSTSLDAINSTLRSLTGDTDLLAMYLVAPFSTVVWYTLFILSMIFVLYNLLVAVAVDHYNLMKDAAGTVTGMFTQAGFFVSDQWERYRPETCAEMFTWWCRTHQGVPTYTELLDALMDRAGLPNEERLSIKRSVIGATWCRKLRERAAFAGKVDEQTITERARKDCKDDIYKFGGGDSVNLDDVFMQRDYSTFLLDECRRHQEMEIEPEEETTLQLRQILAVAEAESKVLLERLSMCQERTKDSLKHVARRFEVIDELVHGTLTELVLMAGPAGVPTKGTTPAATGQNPMGNTAGPLTKTPMDLQSAQPRQKSETVVAWHKALRNADPKGRRLVAPGASKAPRTTR